MSEILDRLEAILDGLGVEREGDRWEMAELKARVTALVETVEIDRRKFDETMTYLRGLQVENRRMLDRVLGPGPGPDEDR